jgi:hypothetical protein
MKNAMARPGKFATPALFSLNFVIAASFAVGASPTIRTQDSVWLVSSRGVSNCCAAGDCAQSLRYWHFGTDCQWAASDLAAFLAEEDDCDQTIVFVHGNRIEAGQDRAVGLGVYASLVPRGESTRVRYVIFSWPAGQIRGPLRDVREKAARTTPAAHHLAAMLAEIDPQEPVGLIGFSYGGPIITGALHLNAGGRLHAYEPSTHLEGPLEAVRAALLVPAQDRRTLALGGPHEQAGALLDHLLLVTNCCDPAMRLYHLSVKCGNPVALGYRGLGGYATSIPSLDQMDACGYIGKIHDLDPYLHSPAIMSASWEAISHAAIAGPSAPPAPVAEPVSIGPEL